MSKNVKLTLEQFLKENINKYTFRELADAVNKGFGLNYTGDSLRKYAEYNGINKERTVKGKTVAQDLASLKEARGNSTTSSNYKKALKRIEELESVQEAVFRLGGGVQTHSIRPRSHGKDGEATCFAIASDWHIEEKVTPDAVNGSPGYSLEIAKKRADEFFQVALHLRDIECQNIKVPTMVVGLLGDFITGNLHNWHMSGHNTVLEPIEAAVLAYEHIQSGLDFLLKESDLNLVIPCHAGNHSRITPKSNDSETEMGNSLELFVYSFLAKRYAGNPRVKMMISKAYASRLEVYGHTVFRFHHGHHIKYGGGIGGIAVPVSKYVLRKNTHWPADFDVFGHHHTQYPGPRFISNGSMIGYNAYASDGGFEYQGAKQAYFLVSEKRPKEILDFRPILFSK